MKPRITKHQNCSAFMPRARWRVDVLDEYGWISTRYFRTWAGALSEVRFHYGIRAYPLPFSHPWEVEE